MPSMRPGISTTGDTSRAWQIDRSARRHQAEAGAQADAEQSHFPALCQQGFQHRMQFRHTVLGGAECHLPFAVAVTGQVDAHRLDALLFCRLCQQADGFIGLMGHHAVQCQNARSESFPQASAGTPQRVIGFISMVSPFPGPPDK